MRIRRKAGSGNNAKGRLRLVEEINVPMKSNDSLIGLSVYLNCDSIHLAAQCLRASISARRALGASWCFP